MSRRALVLVGLAVAIWVAPAAAAPAARSGHTTADEPQYLMSALSLAEDRDLDISDERAEQRYREFHRADLPMQEEPRADGSAVSPHDPLLPALLAVPMGLGGWVGAKFALALLAGVLAAALVWVAVARFRVPARVAMIAVLTFSASAPLAVYGTQVYPELAAALACTGAIAALTGGLDRRAHRALLVACVIALPWLSVKYAPVAAALAALAIVALLRAARGADASLAASLAGGASTRSGSGARATSSGGARDAGGAVRGASTRSGSGARGARGAALLLGVLVAAGVAFAVAHLSWYGGLTPYAAGSHFAEGELTVMGEPDYLGRSIRLAALLLDRDFGLAAWQPAYLLAVPALAAMFAARAPHRGLLVVPLALGWLNATFVALTMHGWWFPGRQVVVVLPCLVLAVAWWMARSSALTRVVAVCGVLGASVYAWLVAQAVFGDLTTVVTFESLTHPLWRAWRLLLPDYRDLTTRDWALHLAWLAALAAAAVTATAAFTRAPRRTGVSFRRVSGQSHASWQGERPEDRTGVSFRRVSGQSHASWQGGRPEDRTGVSFRRVSGQSHASWQGGRSEDRTGVSSLPVRGQSHASWQGGHGGDMGDPASAHGEVR